MNNLFVFAAHNTVVAFVFALVVYGLTRVWRNPPVAHVLWVLVLLKLVAPPVMYVAWFAPRLPGSTQLRSEVIPDVSPIEDQKDKSPHGFVDRPTAPMTVQAPEARVQGYDFGATIRLSWSRMQPVLLWIWLGGAAVCALLVATRVVRFERLLRDTLPASERLQRLTVEITSKLGLGRVPDVRYVDCALAPLLWCAGRRPTIVLPMQLCRRLDDESSALIVAHELAHLRRRDHWVRAVELVVATVYWWNPLVWVIRRQIHECEELCCDAWVRWAFPDHTKRYAEVLLSTAESLNASQVGARLLPASPFLRSLSLQGRILMILESRFAPSVSKRSTFVIALLALLVMPTFIRTTAMEAQARSNDDTLAAPAQKPEIATTSDLPHAVQFEQGATRFLNGDNITILEVRGTSDKFAVGDIYMIKGIYTLASHDHAKLAASITATDAANGRSTPLKVQSTVVNQGKGTFTLYLPMPCRGWPHVSFYPAERGSDFGGNYFGTGDSVLRQWWGSKETDQQTTNATPGSNSAAPSPTARKPNTRATAAEFPFVVRFEQGATQFLNGDKITILEVRGTADTFAPDNTYLIKGTYTLASHDRATLAAYFTAMDAKNGKSRSHEMQRTDVKKGDGSFTLCLPMTCRGWPHVSFYPAGGGSDFGGNYFGTGDSVLKKWWGSK